MLPQDRVFFMGAKDQAPLVVMVSVAVVIVVATFFVGVGKAIRTGGVRTHSTAGLPVIAAAIRAVFDFDGVVLDGQAKPLH